MKIKLGGKQMLYVATVTAVFIFLLLGVVKILGIE